MPLRAPGTALRLLVAVVAAVVSALVLVPGDRVAEASGLVATSTSTTRVDPSATSPLNGLAISGSGGSPTRVTLETDVGTVSIGTTTGLTLAFGNSWTGTSSVTFSGVESDINTALATASITTPAGDTVANISLTAMPDDAGYAYLSSEQRFFEYVSSPNVTWTAADADARSRTYRGQAGYLAAPVSATVNDFVSDRIDGAEDVWIGLVAYESGPEAVYSSTTYARVWRAAVGADQSPEAGTVVAVCSNATGPCDFVDSGSYFSSWATGEPNDAGGTETVAVTNRDGNPGLWNDLADDPDPASAAGGYIVQYGGKTNSDPDVGTGFQGVVTDVNQVVVATTASAPDAPTISADPGDTTIRVSWQPPSDGGAAITSYEASVDSGPWTTISTSSENVTVDGIVVTTVTGIVSGLTNGVSYDVRIRAVNSVGDGLASNTASATPAEILSATSTSTVRVDPSATTALAGLAIDGTGGSNARVTLTTDRGTLSISTTTGLTLGFDNAWSGTDSITFTGSEADINAGLASASLTTPAGDGSADIGLTAMPADAGYVYFADDQRFFEFVASTGVTWAAADADARSRTYRGQQGYLATPITQAKNDFVAAQANGAQSLWIGLGSYETGVDAVYQSTTYARVWRALVGSDQGPDAGTVVAVCTNTIGECDFVDGGNYFSSWGTEQPDDWTGVDPAGEPVAITNWDGGALGDWNDVPLSTTAGIEGYVVEYGGLPNDDTSLGLGFDGIVTDTNEIIVSASATVPVAPVLTGSFGDESIDLEWTPPSNGGSEITGYEVSVDAAPWTSLTTSTEDTTVDGNVVTTVSATLTGLTNGIEYDVQVRALNGLGNGVASAPVSITPATVPDAPTGVSGVNGGDGRVTVSFSAPASDGGSPITTYSVTASPGGRTAVCVSSPCDVTALVNGDPYTFTVVARNAAGGSMPSAASSSVTPFTVPGAPTGVSTTRQRGQIVVSFGAPVDDGGAAITGYTATASPGGQAAGCVSSPCTVTGLDDLTTYTFSVRATNAAGLGAAGVSGADDPDADDDGLPDLDDPNPNTVVAGNESTSTANGTAVTVNVSDNDEIRPGATASYRDTGAGTGAGAATFDAATGVMTYQPTRFESGAVTVVYEVCHTLPSPDVCTTATVTVTIGAPSGLVPIDPARYVDTRVNGETFDGDDAGDGRLRAGVVRTFRIAGRGDVPAAATTAILNLTAVRGSAIGHVTVFGCDDRPNASILNFAPGSTVANAAVVGLSSGGDVCVVASTDTELLVDVLGYGPGPSRITTFDPARLLDTREQAPFRLTGGEMTPIQVAGVGPVSAEAVAVIVNFTAVRPAANGFLSVVPCGDDPSTSVVNFAPGAAVANATLQPLGSDGRVCLFSSVDVDVVIDVSGEIDEEVGPAANVVMDEPVRLVDTRASGETVDGRFRATGALSPGEIREFDVLDRRSGEPDDVSAVIVNVTVTTGGAGGFVSAPACGSSELSTSLVNLRSTAPLSNASVLPVTSDGRLCLGVFDTANVIVDVYGYVVDP